jgi:putative ABC transport system permease protein
MLRYGRLMGGSQILGIEPNQIDRLDFSMAAGAARLGNGQVIVGARVTENFFDPQGRRISQPPDLMGQMLQLVLTRFTEDGQPVERTVRLRVAGVLEKTGGPDDYTVFMSLQDVVELNGWYAGRRVNPARDGYSQVLVKVARPDQVAAVEREILRQGFYAYSAHSILQQINSFFLVVQGILGGIGAIALLVAAFGIANTMLMSIYERTKEIGLMKAVGATNRDVMSVFLAESGSIGLLGGVGGVLLGVLLSGIINVVARTYLMAQAAQSGTLSDTVLSFVHTPFWLPVFAVLFATGVGVLSGVYPATRAASLNPISALRYE